MKLKLLLVVCFLLCSPVHAQKKVLASIEPLYMISSRLLQGVDKVQLLLDSSISPHHFSLKPSQARAIRQADLFIWVGENIESSLHKIIHQLPANRRFAMAELFEGNHQQQKSATGSIHRNQHYWLDIGKVIVFSQQLVARLQLLYPDKKARLQQNLNSFVKQLKQQDRQIRQKFSVANKRPFVLIHNALFWFNRRYHLNAFAVVQAAEHQKPSLKQLLQLKSRLKTLPEYCILADRKVGTRWAAILSVKAATRLVWIDPVAASANAGDSYTAFMQHLSSQLEHCLLDK